MGSSLKNGVLHRGETSHPQLSGGEALNMDQLTLSKIHKSKVITCKPYLLSPLCHLTAS